MENEETVQEEETPSTIEEEGTPSTIEEEGTPSTEVKEEETPSTEEEKPSDSIDLITIMSDAIQSINQDDAAKVMYTADGSGKKVSLAHTIAGTLARLWSIEKTLYAATLRMVRESKTGDSDLNMRKKQARDLITVCHRMVFAIANTEDPGNQDADQKEGTRLTLEMRALFSTKDGEPMTAEEQIDEAIKLINKALPNDMG